MAARAIWKGVLRCADLELPVKLYAAVEDHDVHFRLLHAPDRQPVVQRMVHPGTGETVPADRIRRGFEVEPGVFVVLDDADLEAARPRRSRRLEITRFVPAAEIDHRWYERPYYLGPDGDPADHYAFADALGRSGREGVVRWAMRDTSYVGALRVHAGQLLLVTLRHAGEVIAAERLPAPAGRELGQRELRMAEQLVEALAGEPEREAFADSYRQRLLELIAAKAEGGTVRLRKLRPKAPSDDLEASLEASLRAAGGAGG